ncbi:hypothetical protein HYH03_001691 [Edaphochlamys debaryana]|uniref:Uncharacterized protein n=1 Tax=Edaphochlamys debaryana TaxID=47281 RepID=A0A836C5Q7_9CHLO|nr:hypothetical protein HYH03_001691 [Edaphochlamys debaryana]|eukprot:KAG2500109.1 hypothetical protein HYH03_001691 [Edaphochlamys debaryana]
MGFGASFAQKAVDGREQRPLDAGPLASVASGSAPTDPAAAAADGPLLAYRGNAAPVGADGISSGATGLSCCCGGCLRFRASVLGALRSGPLAPCGGRPLGASAHALGTAAGARHPLRGPSAVSAARHGHRLPSTACRAAVGDAGGQPQPSGDGEAEDAAGASDGKAAAAAWSPAGGGSAARVVDPSNVRQGLRVVAVGPHVPAELRALGVAGVIDFGSGEEEGDWAVVWWRSSGVSETHKCWIGRVGGTDPPEWRYELLLAEVGPGAAAGTMAATGAPGAMWVGGAGSPTAVPDPSSLHAPIPATGGGAEAAAGAPGATWVGGAGSTTPDTSPPQVGGPAAASPPADAAGASPEADAETGSGAEPAPSIRRIAQGEPSSPTPIGPNGEGFLGTLLLYWEARYAAGPNTLRRAFPAEAAALASTGGSERTAVVSVLAAVGEGGKLTSFPLRLTSQRRLSGITDVARALGLQDKDRIELWRWPGGAIELRRADPASADAASAQQPSADAASAEEPQSGSSASEKRLGMVQVGYVQRTEFSPGYPMYISGQPAIRAAFPAALEQAVSGARRSGQTVTLLATPAGADTGELQPYLLTLQPKRRGYVLQQFNKFVTDLGLQHGDKMELWLREDGQVEARRPVSAPHPSQADIPNRPLRRPAPSRADTPAHVTGWGVTTGQTADGQTAAGDLQAGTHAAGAGYLGALQVYYQGRTDTSPGRPQHMTGQPAIFAAFAADVQAAHESACTGSCESRDVVVCAAPAGEAAGALQPFRLWIYFQQGPRGGYRLQGVSELARALGLQHGDRVELWRREDGRVEARRAAPISAPVQQTEVAEASPSPPKRRATPVPELQPLPHPTAWGFGLGSLHVYYDQRTETSPGFPHRLMGKAAVRAAFPAVLEEASKVSVSGSWQVVVFAAPLSDDGPWEVQRFNLSLLHRKGNKGYWLTRVAPLARALRLQHGERASLWRLPDGRIEARRLAPGAGPRPEPAGPAEPAAESLAVSAAGVEGDEGSSATGGSGPAVVAMGPGGLDAVSPDDKPPPAQGPRAAELRVVWAETAQRLGALRRGPGGMRSPQGAEDGGTCAGERRSNGTLEESVAAAPSTPQSPPAQPSRQRDPPELPSPTGTAPVLVPPQAPEPELHAAARLDRVGAVEALLAAGADVDARDGAGRTALFVAAAEGRQAAAEALLQAGARPNAAAHDGWTPFGIAAAGGRVDLVGAMLPKGASVNAPAAEGGLTALHLASRAGEVGVMEVLLRAHADFERLTACLQTPLHLASAHGHKRAAGLLLDAGADLTARNADGLAPLDVADSRAAHGGTRVRDFLVARKGGE